MVLLDQGVKACLPALVTESRGVMGRQQSRQGTGRQAGKQGRAERSNSDWAAEQVQKYCTCRDVPGREHGSVWNNR